VVVLPSDICCGFDYVECERFHVGEITQGGEINYTLVLPSVDVWFSCFIIAAFQNVGEIHRVVC